MKYLIKRCTKVCFLITFIANSFAEVRLSNYFGNNMVLQRNQPNTLWGWAAPDENISITFAGNNFTTIASKDSTWEIKLPSTTADNVSYEIHIKGKNYIGLKDIVFGDVWLCGGQSNMEFTFEMLNSYNELTSKYVNNDIRLINLEKVSLIEPQKDLLTNGWMKSNPQNNPKFSAVAFFFAKELYEKYKVPIGLISSNWGGSPAEVWMSPKSMSNFPDITSEYKKVELYMKPRIAGQIKRKTELKSWTQKAISLDSGSLQSWGTMLQNIPTDWNKIILPRNFQNTSLNYYDGIVWFGKKFDLTSHYQISKDTLKFGTRELAEDIWINGKKISLLPSKRNEKIFLIPSNILKIKDNIILIRFIDNGWDNGFEQDSIMIKSSLGTINSLNGEWSMKKGYNYAKMQEFISPDWQAMNNWQPSSLFNGMINPITKIKLTGAIWYQGESNASRAYQYQTLFPALILDWRLQFNSPEMPFLFVQLANFMAPITTFTYQDWPELREAQSYALMLPKTGMAVTIDIGDQWDIHPKNKKDVGFRLAKLAQKIVYIEPIVASGPKYKSMKIEKNTIVLNFEDIGLGLENKGGSLNEFVIAGEDQNFVFGTAIIQGNSIMVSNTNISKPVAVRYAWSDNPSKANLYNKNGFPASPFRTDNWKMKTFGVIKVD